MLPSVGETPFFSNKSYYQDIGIVSRKKAKYCFGLVPVLNGVFNNNSFKSAAIFGCLLHCATTKFTRKLNFCVFYKFLFIKKANLHGKFAWIH